MASARIVHYSVQPFRYINEGVDRSRPWLAVALLGPKSASAANILPLGLPFGTRKKSLAIYSVENHCCDQQDLFLPSMDSGHLVADRLGGGGEAHNFAPMALDQNRGGGWAALEKAASDCQYGLYVVRLDYQDTVDPRIPIRVRGWLYTIDANDFATLATGNDLARVAAHGDSILGLGIGASVLVGATIRSVDTAAFDQNPLHFVAPTVRYNSDAAKLQRLFDEHPLPNGWAIEDQLAFDLKRYTDGQPIGNTGNTVRHEWNLPPLDQRPNAWFDYLALNGWLDDTVQDVLTRSDYRINPAEINKNYDTRGVPGAYRNLLMVWNRIWYAQQIADQTIYVSQAEDDQSSLGYRFTLAPEIDHIIPFSLRGPTIFSNLRLTSNTYNNARKNSVDPALARNAVKIGPVALYRPKRGATTALGDKLKLPDAKKNP